MDEGERISVVAGDLDVFSFLNAALEESCLKAEAQSMNGLSAVKSFSSFATNPQHHGYRLFCLVFDR
jgi:hypothetical protein